MAREIMQMDLARRRSASPASRCSSKLTVSRGRIRISLKLHPAVRLRRPSAGYLAWLDLSALDWGPDPAQLALDQARVALSHGPAFGRPGAGHARMNIACAPAAIVEAVSRLARAAGA